MTGENHNLFHLGLRAICSLHLILNCPKLTLPVFMTIKASPKWVIPNAHSVTCYDFRIPLSTGFHRHLCYFFRSAGYDWMAQINCLIVRSCLSCVCSSYNGQSHLMHVSKGESSSQNIHSNIEIHRRKIFIYSSMSSCWMGPFRHLLVKLLESTVLE